ncbi:PIG-X [Cokeromyces recurvatus]|uniref:PIG-X n=1 Tax=Cokeromyces recurvatus TaxID=90255 RepID=UPI00221E746B|nr:PIG-X [Cokeromyces recurvatus]KAI7908203.1 PIG-X [Cokeromyces recurvatus]
MVNIHSELIQENSLHPKILTRIDLDENKKNCQLDIVYVLPPSVFVDPYQLKDLEGHLGRATIFGEHDLELPLEKIKETRGSIVFLRQKEIPTGQLQLELPFHLRYQQPSNKVTSRLITIEAPYAGWTCALGNQNASWPPLSDQYPLLPPPTHTQDITFIRLTHDTAPLTLFVPVGKIQDSQLVTWGTFSIVIFCTLWIIQSIFLSIKKRKRSEVKGKRRKSE